MTNKFKVISVWLFYMVQIGVSTAVHAGDLPGWPPTKFNDPSSTKFRFAILTAVLIIVVGFWRRRN